MYKVEGFQGSRRALSASVTLIGICASWTAQAQTADIFAEHYEMMLEFYGVDVGLRHARKHVAWYLDRAALDMAGAEKAAILTSTDVRFVRDRARAAMLDAAPAKSDGEMVAEGIAA